MTDIQFVYFDLGNILVSFDPRIAARNLGRLLGIDEAKAWEVLYASGLEERYEHGELTGAEFTQRLRAFATSEQSSITDQAILDAISDMFTPIESMVRLLQQTRQKIGKIGILSNTCEAHWDWIRRQNWAVSKVQVDVTILSCRVGAMKPAAAIYEAAEIQSGVAAEQILFIDDKPDNVLAAVNRGWNAHCCLGGEPAFDVLSRELKLP
ncbi:HAD family hydrolase [Roseiconus lacunae]|uniref:HAD family phosphatase n=1 Tax=Roseiconus lacunae TaxID=2605694 RepID=A0ABT7PNL6_9BACT|nr:HAD family phosphatase [Roseiconus lacunae]MDM4018077.1 HAD family phosphatase [Roseiconus lacunae]